MLFINLNFFASSKILAVPITLVNTDIRVSELSIT